MLRLLLPLIVLTSCSLSKVDGGDKSYVYKAQDHDLATLKDMAPDLIRTSRRDPPEATLDQLFSKKLPGLKRIGIIVFESKIQETRTGLASADGRLYPSAGGKQILTENFLRIWEEGFPIIDRAADFVPVSSIVQAKSYPHYGQDGDDYVHSSREKLVPEDISYLPAGKKTAVETLVAPRSMRDFSLLLVPAADLMGGAKWSEHQKLMVNDVARELNLDALLVVLSEASWTAGLLRTKIEGTIVVPSGSYRSRLIALKKSPRKSVTVSFRSYQGEILTPVNLLEADGDWGLEEMEKNLLSPLFRAYRDLSLMMMIQMKKDLDETR